MRLNYSFAVARVRLILFGVLVGINFEACVDTGERKM